MGSSGKAVEAGVKASVDVLVKEWENSSRITLKEMGRIWTKKEEEYRTRVAKLRRIYHDAIEALNDKVDEMELVVNEAKKKFYELKANFDGEVRMLLPTIFDELEDISA